MKFKMFVRDDDDNAAFSALKETALNIQSINVHPGPRLLQDALSSRGIDVDMELVEDETEEQAVMRVTRKKRS